jgi:23S rRNA (guanine745-N1)-methyltransferase
MLICPVCRDPLRSLEGRVACDRGHSFDVAREGYVNLAGSGRPQRHTGDSREMVAHRRAFLAAGHFDPLADRIAAHVAAHLDALAGDEPPLILDAGCGPGWYLDAVVRGLGARAARAIGADLSKEAIRVAARRHPHHCFVVADTRELLPVGDRSVKVLLDVFAPRNRGEFRRVLADDGLLVVTIPGEEHLGELPERLRPVTVHPEKRATTLADLEPSFELVRVEAVTHALSLSPDHLRSLVLMGPGARHLDPGLMEIEASMEVTADFELLLMRPAATPSAL